LSLLSSVLVKDFFTFFASAFPLFLIDTCYGWVDLIL
jgi:hypothetical protein